MTEGITTVVNSFFILGVQSLNYQKIIILIRKIIFVNVYLSICSMCDRPRTN